MTKHVTTPEYDAVRWYTTKGTVMKATKHLEPAPSKDTGYSKDPAANTVDVRGEGNWPVQPNAKTLNNMPYRDGQ